MPRYFLFLHLAILFLAKRPDFIASVNLESSNKDLSFRDFSKWRRNPSVNRNLSQLNGDYGTGTEGVGSKHGDSNNSKEDSQPESKISRIELLFGSSGLKLLNSSSVFVLGSNKLSSKIVTHLIRSGVGSVTIYDENKSLSQNLLREILLLNPDSNVNILHTDPLDHLNAVPYSTVILSNQPISLALRLNEALHGKCNFVYASVEGTYGVVLNDFGRHQVNLRSDESYPEHSCTLLHSGNEICLEVNTGTDQFHYTKNGLVEVKYRVGVEEGPYSYQHQVNIEKFRIKNVVKSDEKTLKVWLYTKKNKLKGKILSVRKVDDPFVVHFRRFDQLLKSLLNVNWLQKYFHSVFKKDDNHRLVMSPNSGNSLNRKSLSVLSSFIALSKTLSQNSAMDSDLDFQNFYSIAREIYPNSDENVVSNFCKLKGFHIPGINSLVGALAAQETIKGITHIFTPSELILVDRSDLFSDSSGMIDPADVKYSVDQVSNMSFLLIGSGALGCDYLKLLAEMGVSDVTVVDNDTVDVSNLPRQVLFTINDIGKPKAQSALRNLRLFHNVKGYKHYNMLFSEESFQQLHPKLRENKNMVAISAVDNIEGRVALDNFCVQNNIPLVESGIYGMKCSTSLTVPRLTESFSSSVADQPLSSDRYSCSVKGTPSNIDDCVFYSIELFSWLFNSQHSIFNNFIKDPIRSLQVALDTGSDYFYNLIQIVLENLEIINSKDSRKYSQKVRIWAEKTYNKYVGYDNEFKEQLISTLVRLKLRSLREVESVPLSLDYDKFKSLLNQGFETYDMGRFSDNLVQKNDILSSLDEFLRNYGSTCSFQFSPLVIQEDCVDSTDFVYLMSNLRARKFKIPESDKRTLVQKARNIVPAVSTCVSIASSLSLMELYKVPLLSKFNLKDNSFIQDFRNNLAQKPVFRNNEMTSGGEIELNSRISLVYTVTDSEIKFYNRDKPVFSLISFDYKNHGHLSSLFNNYFFNTATLKYVSNSTDPPKIFTINNKNSILDGLSISYWDHLLVTESGTNLLNRPLRGKFKLFEVFRSFKPESYIYLYELVDMLEFVFDVKVDAITFQKGYVLVNETNREKPLKELVNFESGDLVLHIIARDAGSDKLIELPDIKYTL